MRAERMLEMSKRIGVADVVGPCDIIQGNLKVNLVFVAEIFNTKHGLEKLSKQEVDETNARLKQLDADYEALIEEEHIEEKPSELQS